MIRLCVLGPSGRMGQLILEIARTDDEGGDPGASRVQIVGAVDRAESPVMGQHVAPGVAVVSELAIGLAEAEVYVDFTVPASTRLAAQAAAERGVAGVIGTTGLDAETERAIDALAERAPVVVAPNFSLGVNVLLGLAERAARALGPAFDLEVVEIHHRHKRDAPSGTALAVARALADGRSAGAEAADSGPSLRNRLSREGDVGARPDDEIGVLAVRGGDVAGEHTAYFLGSDERLELTHRAGSRRIFAQGAIHAAHWVKGKPPGRYTMKDVLGM